MDSSLVKLRLESALGTAQEADKAFDDLERCHANLLEAAYTEAKRQADAVYEPLMELAGLQQKAAQRDLEAARVAFAKAHPRFGCTVWRWELSMDRAKRVWLPTGKAAKVTVIEHADDVPKGRAWVFPIGSMVIALLTASGRLSRQVQTVSPQLPTSFDELQLPFGWYYDGIDPNVEEASDALRRATQPL